MSDNQVLEYELFWQCCELPKEEWESWLDTNCDDAKTRQNVLILLHLAYANPDDESIGPVKRGDMLKLLGQSTTFPEIPNHIGPFEIESKIGKGASSNVYKALQQSPQRTVALKCLFGWSRESDAVSRFIRETKILARVSHQNIADIYLAGASEVHGTIVPWIAMEHIDGTDIISYAKAKHLEGNDCIRLIIQVCNAMQHAHEQGIIHRDIKPSNVLVHTPNKNQPEVKILDFGIARLIATEHGEEETLVTQQGTLIGTVGYLAPELLQSDIINANASTDVYAIGVLAYKLLGGKSPDGIENMALSQAVHTLETSKRPKLSKLNATVNSDLELVISSAISKDPTIRYKTVSDFASDLQQCIANKPISVRKPTVLYRAMRFAKRKPLVAALFSVTILLLAISSGLFVNSYFQTQAYTASLLQQTKQTLFEKYRSDIQSAGLAQTVGNLEESQHALNSAPSEYRSWEWNYLDHQLHRGATLIEPLHAQKSTEISMCTTQHGLSIAWLTESKTTIASFKENQTSKTIDTPNAHSISLGNNSNTLAWIDDSSILHVTDVPTQETVTVGPIAFDSFVYVLPSDTKALFNNEDGKLTSVQLIDGTQHKTELHIENPKYIFANLDSNFVVSNEFLSYEFDATNETDWEQWISNSTNYANSISPTGDRFVVATEDKTIQLVSENTYAPSEPILWDCMSTYGSTASGHATDAMPDC